MKIGVVGLGLGVSYVEALSRSNVVDSTILCDIDEKKLAAVAAKHPKVKGQYHDLEQMLLKEKPDAVCVVSPDHFHRVHAEMCLQAGCHVLITKPIATTLEDGKAIILTAEKYQRKLMIAMERRLESNFLKIKELLDEGALGDIVQIRYDCIQDKRKQVAKSPWFASPEAGRSSLIGSGIHWVDIIHHMVGKPVEKIGAFGNKLGTLDFPRDKTVAAIFQFEGGVVGEVSATYEAHIRAVEDGEHTFHLVGTKGVATLYRAISDDWDDWRPLPRESDAKKEGIRRTVDSFLDSVINDKPVLIPAREGWLVLGYCMAADEASAKGEVVTPPVVDF